MATRKRRSWKRAVDGAGFVTHTNDDATAQITVSPSGSVVLYTGHAWTEHKSVAAAKRAAARDARRGPRGR